MTQITKEATTPDMLRLAVAAVLEADKEFRANMPPEWEGDPLSDEIDGLRRVFSSTLPIAGEGKVEWESPEEWEIEQRAFHAVGRDDVPVDVQQLVAKLWAMYCHAAVPSSPGKDGGQEVEAVEILPCPVCGADEGSTYLGKPGPGVVRCFAVGCEAVVGGYSTDDEAIAEWNRRSVAMIAAMTEAYCTKDDDDLTECFRHHILTTIGWQAFGARPGPEMQMYEEGFKAGYRRCQSDNETELGEEEDALDARARKIVGRLRDSLKAGGVDQLDIDNAVDLIVDQAKALAPQPASTALVEIVKELSDYLAIHHFASDRHKAADMVARARSALSSQSTSREGER